MLERKLKIALAFILLAGFKTQAQLTIQNGASFVMQAGAQVTVQGSVSNAGTLTNDGTLKVQSHYTNSGSYTGTGTAGVLEIYGSGNSDINAGSSPVSNLVINKTAVTDVVKLNASITVNNALTLTNGIFTTDPVANPTVALISPATATYTFAAGKEIVGSVKRTSWSGGSSRVFNGTNMQVMTNGGTAPTDVTVTMIPLSAGGDPTQAEREVKRKFTFSQSNGTGFTADVRYPYLAEELNTNIEANIVPWNLVSSEWNAKLNPVTRDVANDYVSTTGITATQFNQEWKLADPNYTMNLNLNLRGAWNGSTAMTTTLQSSGTMPLSQPYNVVPFNYPGGESVASIPANAVDWVLIEHRKPSSGLASDAVVASITGRKAGFLLSNGNVVDLDGITAITVPITKQGPAFITVRHRNHLGVLSNAISSNAAGNFTNDFTSLSNVYKPVGAFSDPMTLLAGATGKYGLWAGDANKSGAVSGTDISAIYLAISALASGYQFTDANLSNGITATDASLTQITISQTGTGSGTNLRLNGVNGRPVLRTNIPDPVSE